MGLGVPSAKAVSGHGLRGWGGNCIYSALEVRPHVPEDLFSHREAEIIMDEMAHLVQHQQEVWRLGMPSAGA
jgi:hypothetical protein